LALAKIVADSGKKGSKAKGLCIFCKKNSFRGLEAINLKLISKYCILLQFVGRIVRKI
jgi:hypothetical protein